MVFKGTYYDGRSSTGYHAEIHLEPFDIRIEYHTAQGSHSVLWSPDRIHPTDLSSTRKITLKYGDFPCQYVESEDLSLADGLKRMYPKAALHSNLYNTVFRSGVWGLAVLALSMLALLLVTYFYILPYVAEKIAVSMPRQWEEKLGETAFEQYVRPDDIDSANSRRLSDFFRQMNPQARYNTRLYVVKEDVVNAFALPGGKIVVYEGILRKISSAEELAALLAHEYSHVDLQHSTKNMARSLSSALMISFLFGDASGITAFVVQNADALKQLGYSRELEHEADANGLKLLKAGNIDPNGMVALFETLKKEDKEIPGSWSFLSTHPLTEERLRFTQKEISRKDYVIRRNEALDTIWHEIKANLDE